MPQYPGQVWGCNQSERGPISEWASRARNKDHVSCCTAVMTCENARPPQLQQSLNIQPVRSNGAHNPLQLLGVPGPNLYHKLAHMVMERIFGKYALTKCLPMSACYRAYLRIWQGSLWTSTLREDSAQHCMTPRAHTTRATSHHITPQHNSLSCTRSAVAPPALRSRKCRGVNTAALQGSLTPSNPSAFFAEALRHDAVSC